MFGTWNMRQLVILDQEQERIDTENSAQPTNVANEVAVVVARQASALLAGQERHPESTRRAGEAGGFREVDPVHSDRVLCFRQLGRRAVRRSRGRASPPATPRGCRRSPIGCRRGHRRSPRSCRCRCRMRPHAGSPLGSRSRRRMRPMPTRSCPTRRRDRLAPVPLQVVEGGEMLGGPVGLVDLAAAPGARPPAPPRDRPARRAADEPRANRARRRPGPEPSRGSPSTLDGLVRPGRSSEISRSTSASGRIRISDPLPLACSWVGPASSAGVPEAIALNASAVRHADVEPAVAVGRVGRALEPVQSALRLVGRVEPDSPEASRAARA